VTTPPEIGTCLNCEAPTNDRFCARCGQRTGNVHLKFSQLFTQISEAFFNLDGTLFRTLRMLFTQPGQLTREYWAGRQVRYLKPFSLYVVSSFLFFLSISYSVDEPFLEVGPKSLLLKSAVIELYSKAPSASLESDAGVLDSPSDPRERKLTVQGRFGGPESDTDSDSGGLFKSRYEALKVRYNGDPNRGLSELFVRVVPNAFIGLIPVLALLLKLFYRRHPYMFSEHLIFAAHLQSVALLLGIPGVLFVSSGLTLVIFAVLTVYSLMSLKRVYQQNFVKTLLKAFLLFLSYGFSLLITVTVALLGVWYFA
jgi:Protein of unknown function (DUF3667)